MTKAIPSTLQERVVPSQAHWTIALLANGTEAGAPTRKALATFSEAYWPRLYIFVWRRGFPPMPRRKALVAAMTAYTLAS